MASVAARRVVVAGAVGALAQPLVYQAVPSSAKGGLLPEWVWLWAEQSAVLCLLSELPLPAWVPGMNGEATGAPAP